MTMTSDFRQEVEKWPFAHVQYKKRYITFIYDRIAKVSASYRKSGTRNTMVTSDVILKMEIWPFCPCTVKNTQYNPCYRNTFVVVQLL